MFTQFNISKTITPLNDQSVFPCYYQKYVHFVVPLWHKMHYFGYITSISKY